METSVSPKLEQVSKRLHRGLQLAELVWNGAKFTSIYSSIARASALAKIGARFSAELDGLASQTSTSTFTPKENQILKRMGKALVMANEEWSRSSIAPNCGDVARAAAITDLAIEAFNELDGFYPITL